MTRRIGIALVGAGFIGGSHALAISAVNGVFGRDEFEAVPEVLVEADAETAEAKGRRFGFNRWTTEWRAAIADCDAVILALPSGQHRDMALFALSAGKHLLCEKPVGLSSAEAVELADAAALAGVSNAVGFTYVRAPLVSHAKAIIDSGELGRPLFFRGRHNEDYLADPGAPHSWRLDAQRAGKSGSLGDLGWHIISIARLLCGPVSGLSGRVATFHGQRPDPVNASMMHPVDNEDWAAITLSFESGAQGTIETSRIAHGRKMDIGFELFCERGSIVFDGERFNELKVFRANGATANAGFQHILVNAAHPDYGRFIPAPAHGNSFNDLKTIELAEFLQAIAEKRNAQPDLAEAVRISRICEAVIASSWTGQWIDAPEAHSQTAFEGQVA